MLDRFRHYWARHRTLFWTLHSVWALATGVAVIVLARERYGFVPWVVLFLVLTWASTVFFGRRIPEEHDELDGPYVPGFRAEATSYVTRTMYQETMFFLIPFYAYSTVVGSRNVGFIVVLAGFALLSCFDLLFDRWLRTSATMRLVFFSTVAFAATNLLIPILLPVDPSFATRVAAFIAVGSSIPLALQGLRRSRTAIFAAVGVSALFLTVGLRFPQLVPPVPLRLEAATFSADFDRETLTPLETVEARASTVDFHGALFLLVEVFAPTNVPTGIRIHWMRDGEALRASRDIEITAHELGFRVWDAWSPEEGGVPAGTYEVVLETVDGRRFGRTSIVVEDT